MAPSSDSSSDDENVNPTAKGASASAPAPAKKSWIPAGLGGSGKHAATVDIPLDDPKKRERDLSSWEEDLRRRERDIIQREQAMNRAGVTVEEKNWPPFFPVIHNDIANEIPIHAQKFQYAAFASWLGIVLASFLFQLIGSVANKVHLGCLVVLDAGLVACLGWNVIAVLVESIRVQDIGLFLLAVIYAISGCPLSYILWYRPLYRAMRTDSMVTFGQFFLFYSMHVGFCVIAAVAPPLIFKGKTLTGILVAIEVLTGDTFVGVLYLLGFALFTVESLISIWVLERVYMYFRGHR